MNLKKMMQYFIGLVSIIGMSIVLLRSYNADLNFCKYEIYGRIDSIKIRARGFPSVKINNQWYHIGRYTLYDLYNMTIGDSILKRKDCNKVYLIRNGITYDMSIEWNLPCKCD